jgi:hypothetical protein
MPEKCMLIQSMNNGRPASVYASQSFSSLISLSVSLKFFNMYRRLTINLLKMAYSSKSGLWYKIYPDYAPQLSFQLFDMHI